MNDSTPYRVPREPGRWRAIGLATVVHAALFAFLYVGIRWQSETPVAVEAEVWSPQAKQAAPRAVKPPPPEPEPQPAPAPKPRPVTPPAPPQAETPPEKTPDIVLERERKRLQQQKAKEQELAEQRKQAERARLAEDARQQKMRLVQQQAEQQAAQKRAAQQDAANEKRLADAAKLKQAEEQRKLQAAHQKEVALQEKKAQAQHDATVRQLTEAAGASTPSAAGPTGSGGNGDAARSQGARADASYTQKVGAKIKSNTIFNGAEELTSNPSVEFAVELLPDGSIRRLRKTRPSGVPGFDEAVSRAIEKSQPFPPDKSGMAPSGFTVSHRPKDQ
jgi:colicin import membrane protein